MDTYVYIHSIYWIGKADKENGLEKLGKNSNFALWRVQLLVQIALLKVQFNDYFALSGVQNKRKSAFLSHYFCTFAQRENSYTYG